jgi:predicted AAA+ superfamily ATPase
MYIERETKSQFSKLKEIYGVVAVVGARQCGKTTFIKEMIKPYNSSFVSFDDPDALMLFEDVKKFEIQYILGFDITALDEAQYVTNAGKKIKYLADNGRKIWLTSSSQLLLEKEVLSHLVGRATIIRMYPFSIREFLTTKNTKSFTFEILQRNIWEHIIYGGYPKVVLTDDISLKKQILKDIYDLMILKDVSKNFSIHDINSLERFTRFLAANISTIIQYNTLSNDIKISFQTIIKFLDALEKSYILARVMPFFSNKAKEIIKQPKIYFIDTGLRNAAINNFNSTIEGNLFENYVYCEIIKLGYSPKYWRTKTKEEVDFVIEKDSNLIPIEIKLTAEVSKGLKAFIDIYNPKYAIIVAYNNERINTTHNKCKIITLNIRELKENIERIFSE